MYHYIWKNKNWTEFSWEDKLILPHLSLLRLKQGTLIQKFRSLESNDLTEAWALILEQETLKTAAIEGEKYDPESVRSSIHRRLGLSQAGFKSPSRHIEGLIEVLIDATTNVSKPLSLNRLNTWHKALFPTGQSGLTKIIVGKPRDDHDGPMQVVSGPLGHEKIHYQAPPASTLEQEIASFFSWWNSRERIIDGVIRSALAHLYFVTLHPYDDGNGRLARALSDMALAQDDQLKSRYYSLSHTIEKNKKEYYQILESTQKQQSSTTDWLIWFLECFSSSLDDSENILKNVFNKAHFWHKHQNQSLNDRQQKVLEKILNLGENGFLGGLTTRKYMGINKHISRITAIRDIDDMVNKKMLKRGKSGGRNISYTINW